MGRIRQYSIFKLMCILTPYNPLCMRITAIYLSTNKLIFSRMQKTYSTLATIICLLDSIYFWLWLKHSGHSSQKSPNLLTSHIYSVSPQNLSGIISWKKQPTLIKGSIHLSSLNMADLLREIAGILLSNTLLVVISCISCTTLVVCACVLYL